MQLINSGYRGDGSDNLSNIMGMRYGQQDQLNKFTGEMGITGINNMAARDRAVMDINSRERMARDTLRETQRSNTLQYMLGEARLGMDMDRLGMEMDNSLFNKQRDVATFNQTQANNDRTQAYNSANLALNTVRANEPNLARAAADAREAAAAGSSFEVWSKNADFVRNLFNSKIESMNTASIADEKERNAMLERKAAMRARLANYDKHVNWAAEQYKTRGASFLTPFLQSRFGNVNSLYELAGLEEEQNRPAPVAQPANTTNRGGIGGRASRP